MRFVAIALFILAIPLLHGWMQRSVRNRQWVWIATGFLPFVIGSFHLDASIISWAMWPGYVKGLLISLLDAAAVAVLMTEPGRRGRTPFALLIGGYVAVALIAVTQADVKMAAFFFAWQSARMLLVMLAVARFATRPDGARLVLYGVMAGAIYQTSYCIGERLHGVAQVTGTMGHQNLLGMILHFAVYPALALILAGRRDKILFVGFAASLLAMMLTGSRGTVGIAAGGCALLIVLSMIRRPSSRKSAIAGAGVAALLIATPLGYSTVSARLSQDSIASSNEEREAFERAAWLMIDDHPMGVGANQYVIVANTQGYSARAGVNWNSTSRSTNVHNTYLLMTAELGYLGGAAFLLLMIVPPLIAFRYAWTNRRDPRGELALGMGVALAAVAVHCMYEWIYVMASVQYLQGIALGIVAGLIRQRQLERSPRRRPILAPPMLPSSPATG